MRTVRNVAIIALLALAVAVLPGGGNAATALLTAVTLLFAAGIAVMLARLWKGTSMTRDVMTDRQRLLFYGSLGALALMVAGLDEMWDSGPGTAVWLVVVVASVWTAITVWREAQSY